LAAQLHCSTAGKETMPAPHLDILKRQQDGSFIWIEAASDMQFAQDRLHELASSAPGEYFVFDQKTQQIIAKVANHAAKRP